MERVSNTEPKPLIVLIGNVSAGNVGVYVPIIMQEIQKDPKKRYLLLHALKEVITRYTQKQGGQDLEAHASEIW